MLNFLWEYRFVIIIIVAVILYAIFSWQNFKTKAYALMLQAKSLAKDAILKSGDQQAEWVVKKAYNMLPIGWQLFITEDRLRKIIYYLYHKAKDYLDDGKINNSIK
jgi:uncharacterized protein (UPF0333 family)